MTWKVAPTILKLREQVNELAPARDKTSDGIIGDASHKNRGKSDHNPNSADIVTAIDLDEDLNSPVSLQSIIDSICASRDKRVKYIIYEGKITVKGSHLQKWKRYVGTNPHNHHAHISITATPAAWNDISDWRIQGAASPAVTAPDSDIRHYIVRRGDSLWSIARSFSTGVAELKSLNGLTSDVLQINQKLRVR